MTDLQAKEILWKSAEAVQATNGSSTVDWSATGVSIDCRTAEPRDLFLAISGPNFDGHDYVGSALQNGASAAMISHAVETLGKDAALLEGEDTFEALK